MGLADTLGLSGSSTQEAPQIISLDQAEEYQPWRLLIYGDYGSGKTSVALSVMNYLREDLQLPPEKIFFAYLDNDQGVLPLLPKFGIPKEYRARMKYVLSHDYPSLRRNTQTLVAQAKEHARQHGVRGTWVIVDNCLAEWRYARDDFAKDVYGMSEAELSERRRQEAIAGGKSMLPTFNHKHDWGPINSKHFDWLNTIVFSGVNYILLTPEKRGKEDYTDDDSPTVIGPAGQKGIKGSVDEALRLYCEGEAHFADLEKTRAAKRFRRMENPSFGRLAKWMEKMMAEAQKA